MLPSTTTETHISISICTPQKAYPRFYDAILSTKYFDDETELSYYGYRYYSPEMGRWLSRDPIGEKDCINVYALVANAPVTYVDYLGLTGSGQNQPSQAQKLVHRFYTQNSIDMVEIMLQSGSPGNNIPQLLQGDLGTLKTVLRQTAQTGNIHKVPADLDAKLATLTSTSIDFRKADLATSTLQSLDLFLDLYAYL